MEKKIVKINESTLRKIVAESVKKVLEEANMNELFGFGKKKKAAAAAPQRPVQQPQTTVDDSAQRQRQAARLGERAASLQCDMQRIGDSSDSEYRELSAKYDELQRQGYSLDKNSFETARRNYLSNSNFGSIKASRDMHFSHAGEDYSGGRSSWDNMGR